MGLNYPSPSLEHYDWILVKITQVNALAALYNFRTLLATQPAHVRKEESALSVVRVGVCVCVLVVRAVVAGPFENAVLVKVIIIKQL